MTEPPRADDSLLLVHAYLDGELDAARALEVERRIASEPALAAERDRVAALRRLVHERLPPEAVPAGLAARVERLAPLRRESSWRALAASVALAAVLGSGVTWFALRADQTDAVADQVVASHIRALMVQATDVNSSDRHTVKPWFNGRIPQAPRVVDLTHEGFPLVGGRIDVIGRTPVPTLVYRHRQHLISLVAVPATAEPPWQHRASDGYNLVRWRDGDVAYWAVSDLGAGDLDRFAQAFRTAPSEQ
ncbi:MAG TPA: anti-sigma factor [Xanthobacteraceae bacterium]|nr:anti-sigma factor [Xanthobacteraceae bacterium]